jgi:MYXO-CTERM domain-containing protein
MGPEGAADTEVRPAEKNEFQTRFNNMHPDITVLNCEAPERHRWGKPPRTYRGSKKIWIAEDLARKSRTQLSATENVHTAVPDLGLPGKAKPAPPAPAPTEEKGACGCKTPGGPSPTGWLSALGALLVGTSVVVRRRGRSRGAA